MEAAQVGGRPLAPGGLRPQDQRPVFKPFADNFGVEAAGGGLQSLWIGDGYKETSVDREVHATAGQEVGAAVSCPAGR